LTTCFGGGVFILLMVRFASAGDCVEPVVLLLCVGLGVEEGGGGEEVLLRAPFAGGGDALMRGSGGGEVMREGGGEAIGASRGGGGGSPLTPTAGKHIHQVGSLRAGR
jgi:hypothetical protein